MALITVYMTAAFITTVAGAAYSKSLFEMRQVDRELARIRSFAAAEAAVQDALRQIANNGATAYTGYIDTSARSVSNFSQVDGTSVGSYSYTLSYPNQADWVTISATAVVDGETRNVEARVFLDSNLSKYLVYANSTNFNSGTDAQYGEPDYTDAYGDGVPDYPEFVPSTEAERASLYFTGTWTTSGTNVEVYGDVNAQTQISGNTTSEVHGDAYVGAFATNGSGSVTNSGVTGSLVIGDGFSDDLDRNNSGSVTSADYPDYHDLTSVGGGDSHKTETLDSIDNTFYKAKNSIPSYGGSTSQNRFLKFVSSGGGASTQVVEYTNSTFTTVASTTNLANNAIVYVNGNIYAKGEIGGRVSVVSSNSIYFDGNTTYSGGQTTADTTHSAAFMAKNKLFFRANTLSVSGILYSENSSNASADMDSDYDTNGNYNPSTKQQLRLSGNRIINGSTNLGNYPDRVYGYDKNLKYYRPPGIPVYPALRTVREK